MTVVTGQDNARTRREITVGGNTFGYYSIPAAEAAGLGAFARLPASLKVVLDRLIRITSDAGEGLQLPAVPLRHRVST